MSEDAIPIIEVSHLPAAASFYAAITQSLGIRYLSASQPPGQLHFGFVSDAGPTRIFTLQQSAATPPPLSHITLLAQSPDSINSFYNKSLLANNAQTDHSLVDIEGEIVARTRDLDGNMLEAVYSRRRPMIEPPGSKEARRVLEWQHDVARSVAASGDHSPPRSTISHRAPATYQRADSYPPISHENHERPLRLVRRETITTEHYRRPDEASRGGGGGGSGGGFNGMKLVGTLLGAAAGAAVAYAMVRSESPSRMTAPPPRRASYDHTYSPVIERVPARSYVTREVEEPQYVTIAAPPRTMRQRRLDERSHVSQRTGRSEKHGSTRERSRSEAGSRYEYPRTLAILPGPPSREPSKAPSHVSHHSHRSEERHSHHGSRKDSDTYVSARSKRSGVQYIAAPAASRSSTTTIRVVPQGGERRSEVSARLVPLPESRVGGYAASVAPSDSVSSVGFKRERERLRDRMRERF